MLRAPTGAGKTTRVAPALLDTLASEGKVLLVEPRRLAARAAASRIAAERGARLGGEIGYRVRFDSKAGAATRLVVVTEGVLVRRMQSDPFLDGIATVIFDEFHERNLDADLGLSMVRTLQRELREDLSIVAMSATLDAEPLARYLGQCPVVVSEGRLFPVDISYRPPERDERLEVSVARAVAGVVADREGDVLVFLPGVREIRRTAELLDEPAGAAGMDVVELYGDLPAERQDEAIRGGARRRIVLATNVAESSVTVAGVTAVVDSGLARVLRYEPAVGLDRLELVRIARASADQRAGRAGRTAPGVCVRLWSEHEDRALRAAEEPEIRRVDLSGALLQLSAWGDGAVAAADEIDWFERPDERAMAGAGELLSMLGAVDAAGITELGRAMVRLPVGPRIARMLVEGARLGAARSVAAAGALLAERDPLRGRRVSGPGAGGSAWESDLLDRVALLERGDPRVPHFLVRVRDQLLRALPREIAEPSGRDAREHAADRAERARARAGARRLDERSRPATRDAGDVRDEAVLRAVLAAYPDRIARRRAPGERRAVMVGGRGVRLAESSTVVASELFVCLDIDAGRRGERAEALVRTASAVEREWLPLSELTTDVSVELDEDRQCVTALERTRYRDLVLGTRRVAVSDDAAASRVLAEAVARDPARALALDDPAVASLRARVAFLREHMPELDLPPLDDDALGDLLPELCVGRRSFDDLRRAPLAELLLSRLDHGARQALDRHAPERLGIPSGSRVRLVYEPSKPPVLAARIQELFGLAETPRVAAGRVAVLVHLLAPNGRPQQVTDDLASFWSTTYAEVRKELRRRYPKHAWPEDPWNAPAERRPRRRR